MRLTAWRFFAIASLLPVAAVAATRPHYGGTLRVQMKARVAALDLAALAAEEKLASLAFDRLVTLDELAQPQPALAASWRHDADFKRWEFQLRPGVKFHDGTSLTAAAAASALERLGATAVGDTLVIRSDQPAPKLLAALADTGQSIWKRGADGALVGTGPFRIANWEPGKRAVFAANEDYWAGRPYLDGVEIEMGRSPRDQALDFDLKSADLVELGVNEVRRAAQNGRKTWTSAPADLLTLVFDPASEERVREAIALSIDRAAIHNVLLQKQGAAAGALLPQWLSGYEFLFPDSRDLERARRLARGAPPVTIAYDPQDAMARLIVERIAVNAREAGLVIRPVAGAQPGAARITRARIQSTDAGQALASAATALGFETAAPASPEALYAAERTLLLGFRVIPLFHLPELLGLGSRVRNWTPTRWGGWKLENVWLAPEKP
jgi:peptide/nickel transport system substrate-binding protein